MMTGNPPLEDWGKLVGDVPSATAILDRFLHHAEIVSITGKSYAPCSFFASQEYRCPALCKNTQASKTGKSASSC
jgi:hypothetical protein